MKIMLAAVGSACFAAFAPGAIVHLPAAADNTLYESQTGALSNGAGQGLFAGLTGQSLRRRGLIAFDLSSIPPGSIITSASLSLTLTQTAGGPSAVSLRRTLATWGEGTSNATAGGGGSGAPATAGDATWLHRFSPGTTWTAAGGDLAAVASASTSVGSLGAYAWSSPALAADVQAWLNGAAVNAGWAVVGDESLVGAAKRFGTRESVIAAERPLLTIEYAVPAPGTLAPLALLAFAARRRRVR